MDEIVIEVANSCDIPMIANLEKSYPYEVYSENEIEKMLGLDYYQILVAKIDSQIIGYICATIIFDECNILKIIVDENYRRTGVGKKLIDKLINVCQTIGAKSIYLEVRDDNLNAISFYEKNGFKFECIRKGYYQGLDAKIFRKYL